MNGRKVTPTGVLVARYDTPREEWLRLRRHGIGGSDALAVLGLDPWKTRMEVYLDKTGTAPDRDQSDRMRWGQIVEDSIVGWFAEQTGVRVRRCGLLRNITRPWQQVSVDRLTADGGVLEIKNTNYHRRREWEDDDGEIVADGAEAQGQHALAVTGYSHVWVAAQIGGDPPVIRRVERDDSFIADLTALEEEFWGLVESRTPPALEGRASADLIARMYPDVIPGKSVELTEDQFGLLGEYREQHAAEKAASNRKDEIKALITAVMGDAELATYNSEPVARWGRQTRTSVPKENIRILRARHPDLARDLVIEKPTRQFGVTLKGAA